MSGVAFIAVLGKQERNQYGQFFLLGGRCMEPKRSANMDWRRRPWPICRQGQRFWATTLRRLLDCLRRPTTRVGSSAARSREELPALRGRALLSGYVRGHSIASDPVGSTASSQPHTLGLGASIQAIPAASSGASSPLSAGSSASFRTAVIRTLMETDPRTRASRDTRRALTVAS
jgi:hypothetical protein